jgi:hypothetical protein
MLKAIETSYNGYAFRSRIEARFAVFFDACNLEYEYEKEGFDLSCGYYLPDFWMPTLGCWIEIKGQAPADEEVRKAKALAQAGERPVLIFHKLEAGAKGGFAHPQINRFYPNTYAFAQCDRCTHIDVIDTDAARRVHCPLCATVRSFRFTSPTLRRAYEVARSARFEHGATPIPGLVRHA